MFAAVSVVIGTAALCRDKKMNPCAKVEEDIVMKKWAQDYSLIKQWTSQHLVIFLIGISLILCLLVGGLWIGHRLDNPMIIAGVALVVLVLFSAFRFYVRNNASKNLWK